MAATSLAVRVCQAEAEREKNLPKVHRPCVPSQLSSQPTMILVALSVLGSADE